MTQLKTIVVVGGSFVGTYAVDQLAPEVYKTHQVVMIEKNSHIQHLFAFPRISVVPVWEQKAFIPFTNAFNAAPPHSTSVVRGVVEKVLPDRVLLAGGEAIPYEYLIMASGTGKLPMEGTTKAGGMGAKRAVQDRIREGRDVVIVGGGAYGIQLAFDTKEFYPSKNVTLVHSREQLMPRFHPKLHAIVTERAKALGVNLILGQRARIPPGGFPTSGPRYTVELADGRRIPADVAVSCIGTTPLSAPILSLSRASVDPKLKFILVQPTMQIADPLFPRVFAVGDVAATSVHKAAGPGHRQADVAVRNIVRMIAGYPARTAYVPARPRIRLSLGLHSYVWFQDPEAEGQAPGVRFIDLEDGGHEEEEIERMYECRVKSVWQKRAPGVTDYYL
ncbi:FAD/NAD-P-binding domain-containing protein [Mycena rosella]|uniref:FAD/NAD-P-binding domain-containing protein n=1 Tax=Mycena rosella TaxID=1033263 RepID=A0AAD7GXC7_MYCRO|nr:FAD/NAD-P-binding domain-containing protein [Mycena rosella]